MKKHGQKVLVDKNHGPDADGKFLVFVAGGMQSWTLDRIKQAIAEGDNVSEWNEEKKP